MTTPTEILRMIETVSPDDTAMLNHIDTCVFEFVTTVSPSFETTTLRGDTRLRKVRGLPKYTRSRDALKAIRPKGWGYALHYQKSKNAFMCVLDGDKLSTNWDNRFPTEELAELHAIIQAIDYERNGVS